MVNHGFGHQKWNRIGQLLCPVKVPNHARAANRVAVDVVMPGEVRAAQEAEGLQWRSHSTAKALMPAPIRDGSGRSVAQSDHEGKWGHGPTKQLQRKHQEMREPRHSVVEGLVNDETQPGTFGTRASHIATF